MRLASRRPLRQPDVLAARPLGSLTALEGHRLSLVKLVEGDLRTSRIVKEVPVPSSARMKPNPLPLTRRLTVPFRVAIVAPSR